MTAELAEPQRWRANRWYAWIALVLATQFGLIFWLGKPQQVIPRRPDDLAPLLQLTGPDAAKALTLNDPTLLLCRTWKAFLAQPGLPSLYKNSALMFGPSHRVSSP